MRQVDKLSASTTDPTIFERELRLVSKIALLNRDKASKQKTLQEFEFLLDCMQNNKVEQTSSIKARVFEFATLNGSYDLANSMLRALSGNGSETTG
jgi:hypothetical protein